MGKKSLIGFLIFFSSSVGFPRSDVSLGSQFGCHLRFFSKLCMWSTEKLTLPAYCVAANCNNSQTTPGITMHELPRNRPGVRRKWIKFIQFKRADFLAAPHQPICVASTSVSAISQTPCRSWHDVPVLFQNPAWQAQTDTTVSLWVSRAKYQFRLRSSSSPFCSDSPE